MASVLILEDDEDMRSLLCELFLMGGAERCLGVGSVEELRRRGDEVHQAQLALIDINLGSGKPSGLDAFAWLQSRRYGGQVVFVTGHAASHPLLAAAERLRGVRVLKKPVEPEVLVDLLPEADGASAPL